MFLPHFTSGLGTCDKLDFSRLVVLDAPLCNEHVRNEHAMSGCQQGPNALHRAGIVQRLYNKGRTVHSRQLRLQTAKPASAEAVVAQQIYKTFEIGIPIALGGTWALSLAASRSAALWAEAVGRPLYSLKLVGQTQINLKQPNLKQILPLDTVPGHHICLYGLQNIQAEEQVYLNEAQIAAYDIQSIEKQGLQTPLIDFLGQVRKKNAMLHVSLDPSLINSHEAPGALYHNTCGGVSAQDARVIVQTLSKSGLVTSLDVVCLNPAFDMGGRTAHLIVDLVTTLFDVRCGVT